MFFGVDFSDPAIWASFATLTLLEIVLGIDNIVFLSIVAGKLPPAQQPKVRRLGLGLALLMRLALLASISWIVGLTAEVFSLFGHAFSWRDLVLLGGGLFLIAKGTMEIHHEIEGHAAKSGTVGASFAMVLVQVVLLDVVFSLDSVITAVGMSDHLPVMIAAVLVSMAVMLLAAGPVGRFVMAHPTVKMLALNFLLLVGLMLIADGFGAHIDRGYLYAAIVFSILVEACNQLVARRRAKRVH